MNDDDDLPRIDYEQAVIRLIQNYGLAMEHFGRASEGSPVGMENTMRLAKEAAEEVLWAALGREPTLQELEQLPPLYEGEIISVSLDKLAPSPSRPGRPPRRKH